MRTSVKIAGPIVGVAVAVGALLVGSATAQPAAPAPSWDMHNGVLSRAAANLGVPEARLTQAMDQAHDQVLDDAVKAGQLTQAQADQMKQIHRQMAQGGGAMGGMMGAGTAGFGGMMGQMALGIMSSSGAAACHGTGAAPAGG